MTGSRAAAVLVVAAQSARYLAESAAQGGWDVIALDLFGDADTRRVARRWAAIGDAGTLSIAAERLRNELLAARADGAEGWIAGSGLEARLDLLTAHGSLPLLGMDGAEVAPVRTPALFFATLARLGLPHPATLAAPPASPAGWLAKRAGGTGGWHIRDATLAAGGAAPDVYFQRVQPGVPMSALFVADGRRCVLIALNRLLVGAPGCRYAYRGAIGPIERPALRERVVHALQALVPAFGLRGLASLDFIADGDTPVLLEVNPRPSASMALHARVWPGGLLRAHVRAIAGELPHEPPRHASGTRGSEIVFAARTCRIDAALAAALGRSPDCHDLPAADSRFGRGAPICTVSAVADGPAAVEQLLAERRAAIESRMIALASTT
ncbi:MAG: ATP-grasp domain-containing protein [Burkholderiaceae bacterium]